MAERLLKSSPLAIDGSGKLRTGYIGEIEQDHTRQDEIGEEEAHQDSTYTIQIAHSYHVPEVSIKSSPLYGNWKPMRGSPISEALKKRVPEGIAGEAICDWSRDSPRERRAWFTGEGAVESMPWRIARRLREQDAVKAGGGIRRVTLGANS